MPSNLRKQYRVTSCADDVASYDDICLLLPILMKIMLLAMFMTQLHI